MLDNYGEECGIAGGMFHDGENIVPSLYSMILNLQNRGQLSCGFSTYNSDRDRLLLTHKDLGNVNQVFLTHDCYKSKKLIQKHAGDRGIAHTRYATCGVSRKEDAHPFERIHGRKHKWFSLCFNGNIANFTHLRDTLLQQKNYHLIYDNDTEILMHNVSRAINSISRETQSSPDPVSIFERLGDTFDGAYNIGMINAEGKVMAVRDPHGFRPLCYSVEAQKTLFASESIALNQCGVDDFKNIRPGEMLVADNDEVRVDRFAKQRKVSHCMFEWIYFANISSVLDDRSVYVARSELGKELARIEPEDMDEDHVVIPVPDSSKPYGDAYAFELGVPSREGLIRNRYVGRTFIEGEDRKHKIEHKFSVLKEIIKDKKVLLVDDSIVRGSTSKKLVNFLRTKGKAKEVHLRIACPPILSPCFYGIDMSTFGELIASEHFTEHGEDISEEACQKIANQLGADSLIYQKLKNIPKCIGLPESKLCMACLNGEYPTEWGCKLYEKAKENQKKGICNRTYE